MNPSTWDPVMLKHLESDRSHTEYSNYTCKRMHVQLEGGIFWQGYVAEELAIFLYTQVWSENIGAIYIYMCVCVS